MELLEHENRLSIKRKCELLHINRSGLYYRNKSLGNQDVELMNEIRDIYTQWPFYGYRKIHVVLLRTGYKVNRKKVQRLMQVMGLKSICPKKRTSICNKDHEVYPYLLKNIAITRPNRAWQVDITYIKIRSGFVYLICLIDIYSRRIMGWHLSTFLDTNACECVLEKALSEAQPEIINSDQGSQFTSDVWCNKLICNGIAISMDGRGRWADNIYIERLWRTIKYELIYLHRFETVAEVRKEIEAYVTFYNTSRPHQSLGYKTPNEVYKELKYVKSKEEETDTLRPFLGGMKECQIFSQKLS